MNTSGRPTDEEAAEHAEKALLLRKRGKSYRAIAREVGFASSNAAYKAVMKLLQANQPEPAVELRSMEAERLDDTEEYLFGLLETADQPLFVVDRILKVRAQRAVLLGLNKPVVVEDDLGDQLVGLFKRVRERYKRLREADAGGDAGEQNT